MEKTTLASAPPETRDAAPAASTRDLVRRFLLERGSATVPELALALDLTQQAVRRHLDALVDHGVVTVADRPPFGPEPSRGRGRPARVYALTESGRASFPSTYDDLAVAALAFLRDREGADAVRAFAQARADALQAALRDRLGDDWATASTLERADALAAGLSSLGFAASAEPTPGGAQLCQHHCPVAHVAEQFPALCEAETQAFSELLGSHVQRLATLAHGDGVCTTAIPLVPVTPHGHRASVPSPERNSA